MNPLRKRFFGDTETAQRYTGEAIDLLEAVHRQRGDLEQYQMHRVLGNGVELFASTRFGQDEVRVMVNQPVPKKKEGQRSYCVWEDDAELFTVPMMGPFINGPHTAGKSIQFGGETREVNNVRDFTVHTLGNDFSFVATFSPLVDTPGENPTDPTTALYVQPDLKTNKFHAPYGTLFFSTETVGFYLWDEGDAAAIEVDRVSDYPSHATGPFPGTGPMHGFGGYYKSPSISAGKYYNTDDGSGTANSDSPPMVVKFSQAGDIFQTTDEFFKISSIKKVGVASGEYADLGFPSELTEMESLAADFAIQNDNKTVWLLSSGSSATEELKLHRYTDSDGWKEVSVDGGLGTPAVVVSHGYSLKPGGASLLPILHDPITDAICVIKGDYSGAWIFNAHDCNNEPIGAFFHKFKNVPIDLNPVFDPDSGSSYQKAIYSYVAAVQFYNGRIYVRYSDFDHGVPSANFDVIYSNVGACYKVGKILQKKQTNVE